MNQNNRYNSIIASPIVRNYDESPETPQPYAPSEYGNQQQLVYDMDQQQPFIDIPGSQPAASCPYMQLQPQQPQLQQHPVRPQMNFDQVRLQHYQFNSPNTTTQQPVIHQQVAAMYPRYQHHQQQQQHVNNLYHNISLSPQLATGDYHPIVTDFPQQSIPTYNAAQYAAHQQQYDELVAQKSGWIRQQRLASLLIPPYLIDAPNLCNRFQQLLASFKRANLNQNAIDQLIKASFLIEWPKSDHQTNGCNEQDATMLDFAPLMHQSRDSPNSIGNWQHGYSSICTIQGETGSAASRCQQPLAGSVYPVRREGQHANKRPRDSITPQIDTINGWTKYCERPTAIGDRSTTLPDGTNCAIEQFTFKQSALCVDFGEIGVKVDLKCEQKRSRHDQYCIEVNCELAFNNQHTIQQIVHSNPFLIVVNQEENERIIGDFVCNILPAVDEQQNPKKETGDLADVKWFKWGVLKWMLRNFVKSQHFDARPLDDDELKLIQCMLFMPLALGQESVGLDELESKLFDTTTTLRSEKYGIKRLKYRLLREFVSDSCLVSNEMLMKQKCVSIRDCKTILDHNVWQWLFKASELIIDRNPAKLLCPLSYEKNVASGNSMCQLFNNRVLTMSSEERLWKVYKTIYLDDDNKKRQNPTKAIAIRFCDENMGYLAFMFSNMESTNLKPKHGPLAASEIKDFAHGLPGMLFESPLAKKYDRIIYYQDDTTAVKGQPGCVRQIAKITRKETIFPKYKKSTNNLPKNTDKYGLIINPMTGAPVAQQLTDNFDIALGRSHNGDITLYDAGTVNSEQKYLL